MKSIAMTGKKKIEIRSEAMPQIRDNFVRIKTHSVPLGTESSPTPRPDLIEAMQNR
jgi:hypothetical protein